MLAMNLHQSYLSFSSLPVCFLSVFESYSCYFFIVLELEYTMLKHKLRFTTIFFFFCFRHILMLAFRLTVLYLSSSSSLHIFTCSSLLSRSAFFSSTTGEFTHNSSLKNVAVIVPEVVQQNTSFSFSDTKPHLFHWQKQPIQTKTLTCDRFAQ